MEGLWVPGNGCSRRMVLDNAHFLGCYDLRLADQLSRLKQYIDCWPSLRGATAAAELDWKVTMKNDEQFRDECAPCTAPHWSEDKYLLQIVAGEFPNISTGNRRCEAVLGCRNALKRPLAKRYVRESAVTYPSSHHEIAFVTERIRENKTHRCKRGCC